MFQSGRDEGRAHDPWNEGQRKDDRDRADRDGDRTGRPERVSANRGEQAGSAHAESRVEGHRGDPEARGRQDAIGGGSRWACAHHGRAVFADLGVNLSANPPIGLTPIHTWCSDLPSAFPLPTVIDHPDVRPMGERKHGLVEQAALPSFHDDEIAHVMH